MLLENIVVYLVLLSFRFILMMVLFNVVRLLLDVLVGEDGISFCDDFCDFFSFVCIDLSVEKTSVWMVLFNKLEEVES